MAISAKITNADRSLIIRSAWTRAYVAAITAIEPVRPHLGGAMRSAWADFRQSRAEGVVPDYMTEVYEEKIARPGRAEAREYLKVIIAWKSASAAAPMVDEAAPAPVEETVETDQLCMLTWIVDDAIRAGEPGLYAVDQVEPVAPPLVMSSVKAATVAEPKPIQMCIIDLIDADAPEAEEPAVVGNPETVTADQDDEDVLDEGVIEEVFDPRRDLLARIARNDAAMERIEQEVRRNVEIYGMSGGVDHMHDLLDDMHTHGMNLRDDLKEISMKLAHLPLAMVSQLVQQQQAQALSVDPRIGQLENLRALLKDVQWDVDNLTGLCNSTFRYGSDHANLDAHARLDEKWEEREDALNDVRRLEVALGISPLTTR